MFHFFPLWFRLVRVRSIKVLYLNPKLIQLSEDIYNKHKDKDKSIKALKKAIPIAGGCSIKSEHVKALFDIVLGFYLIDDQINFQKVFKTMVRKFLDLKKSSEISGFMRDIGRGLAITGNYEFLFIFISEVSLSKENCKSLLTSFWKHTLEQPVMDISFLRGSFSYCVLDMEYTLRSVYYCLSAHIKNGNWQVVDDIVSLCPQLKIGIK